MIVPVMPGFHLSNVAEESVIVLGKIPYDARRGAQLRSLWLTASERIPPDSQDYWLVQAGKIVGGVFTVLAVRSLAGGLAVGLETEFSFQDPVLYTRGDAPAIRLCSRGLPGVIAGLSVVPEWGILSKGRSSRG